MEFDGETLKASTRKGSNLIYDKDDLIKADLSSFHDYDNKPLFSKYS